MSVGFFTDLLSWLLLVAGGFFFLVGAIGLNRMPDVFTRMHAVSVGDTLGAGLLVAGMALQAGPTLVTVKLFLILLVIWFTGPVATHALARAALQDKLFPLVANRSGKFVEGDPDKVAPRASAPRISAKPAKTEAKPSKR
jgi:multicomponent Na+:H+ antiporter subunit G